LIAEEIRIRWIRKAQNHPEPDPQQVYKKDGDAHMSGEAELCFEIFATMLAAVE